MDVYRPVGSFPAQHQSKQPGIESFMNPLPIREDPDYIGCGKLRNKVALVTGGDSGIGRAVAIDYAKEGAHVAIVYYNEHQDAEETRKRVEAEGVHCLLIAGDIGDETFCENAVDQTVSVLGSLDILVNNAAEQHPQPSIQYISQEQLERTFRTNIFSMFYLTKAALKYLKPGNTIINTTSVTAYEGNEQLIDYSCTKGAIVTFTRSMAKSLVNAGIRVNGVAPGPIWTPLIPSSFSAKQVQFFGLNTPMGRAGQPAELAPVYVFLASDDSSYMTGQVIHANGGGFVTT